MGWGRMLLLGNWGQQMDIEDQQQEIEDLKQRLDEGARAVDITLKNRVAQLEKDNSELRLYTAALVRYLGYKGLLDQDDFRKLVDIVDGQDGSIDGGYKGKIVK